MRRSGRNKENNQAERETNDAELLISKLLRQIACKLVYENDKLHRANEISLRDKGKSFMMLTRETMAIELS